ncbi:MAG: pyridoxal phosphate-dependent aminotransferase [Deltaproteobacteria bacterium]|nr:pyridoxal phosphate-dependent aminotransferase [Deltaproteobacteria bacterium]
MSGPRFARRAAWDLTPGPLAARAAERRARGQPVLDLADANPTRAGFREPAAALAGALAAAARDPRSARYEPDPRGPLAARAAIAALHACDGAAVGPGQVLLTAGTSEGYAHLFRVLADPGDLVHLPAPGYPLFEHLAALEGVDAHRYPLREPAGGGARWRIDVAALAAAIEPRSRAIVLIHPHNPTGSFVDPADLAALRALAAARRLALVSDEVFADSALTPDAPAGALAGAADGGGPLHFVLSGASKLLALPQLKVAWIVVAGPAAARDEALARLEFAADAYLSVSPLLAAALPGLLGQREAIGAALRARVAANRTRLVATLEGVGAHVLPAEAGWAAIVRVPGARDEEALALGLLDGPGLLVQPGFLFDLEPEDPAGAPCAHLVVALLLESGRFASAAGALAAFLAERRAPRSS